jgi:DICT domain-containing protein
VASEELTATQLSERTGVASGTLRVWETRYGFPVAQRLSGNRKRYSGADVEQVAAVLEHRRSGLSLSAAIERVRDPGVQPPQSMFAALREARPDLAVRVYSKRMLIALSHAIEDEHAARATGGILIGSFQRERHYRASERRWRKLAKTADLAVVLAEFDALNDTDVGPVEVPLAPQHPMEREWTVVLHSPSASACLAALEVPSDQRLPESQRSFELIWSCDPAAAHAAVLAAAKLLAQTAPSVAARIPVAALEPAPATVPNLRFSDDLATRAFAYLIAAADPRTQGLPVADVIGG